VPQKTSRARCDTVGHDVDAAEHVGAEARRELDCEPERTLADLRGRRIDRIQPAVAEIRAEVEALELRETRIAGDDAPVIEQRSDECGTRTAVV
jgi:hypothetical protein